jgi:hypothetical protein
VCVIRWCVSVGRCVGVWRGVLVRGVRRCVVRVCVCVRVGVGVGARALVCVSTRCSVRVSVCRCVVCVRMSAAGAFWSSR